MSDDTPMPETGEETTKALIASLKQGKGITFSSSIKPEFLTQINKLLAEVDTSQIGAPDTLIFTAEEVFPESEMRLTVKGHAPVSGRAEQVTLTQTREMHGMFWGEPEGFVFALGDKFLRLGGKFIQADTPEEEPEAEQEWRRLCEVLNDRNRSRGFKPPFAEPPIASAQNPPQELSARTKPGRVGSVLRLPDALPHYTFAEAREVHRAIGDGPALRHWAGVEGEIALRHAIPGETLQTKFAPSARLSEFRRWAGANLDTATGEHLRQELARLSFDANLLFGVSLALCIEKSAFTATLDELAAAISWQPKSVGEREENRLKIWTWLLVFDSLRVVGLRKGSYRDGEGAQRDLTSDDDLMHIAGTRGETTLDGIPHEVSLTVGPWIGKLRGDKQVLTYLGNLRTLASKPRGQLAQRLAVKTGIGLEQLWREKAAHHQTQVKRVGNENRLSVQFAPFTRRQLLTTYGQGMAQEVEEALGGKNPARIRTAWQEAIPLLKEWRIVGDYKELDPMPEERKNWDTFWYEKQQLDVRPAPLIADDVAEVKRARLAADKAKKRGRTADSAKK